MRLLRLKLSNFRSHEDTEIDLAAVSAAAVTGPNGAGKSSIIEGVAWALYGGDPDGSVRTGETRCGVELDLEVGGYHMTISRGREVGKKSWLVIESGGEVLETHTIAAAQDYIVQTIGMDEEQFAATVFFRQGQAGMLAAMRPGERKALLAELLGLDHYEGWRERAAAEQRRCAQQEAIHNDRAERARERLGELAPDGDRALLEERVQACMRAAADLAGRLTAAERDAEQARKAQLREHMVARMAEIKVRGKRAEQDRAARAALREQVEAASASVKEWELAEAARLRHSEAQSRWMAEQQAARRALADAQRRMAAAEARSDALFGEVKDMRAGISAMHPVASDCPTCGQRLTDTEAFEKAKATMVAQADARDAEARELLGQALEIDSEVQRLREQLDRPPEPDEFDLAVWQAAQEAQQDYMTLRARLRATPEPDDPATLRAEWERLRTEAAELPREAPEHEDPKVLRSLSHQAQVDLAHAQRARDDAERDARTRAELEDEIAVAGIEADRLRARAASLGAVARAFGRDGIPAMILDNAVGAIEVAANDALQRLGSSMQLALVTQRAKKSGKGMAETLEIVVRDGVFERPLSSFSGGERYRAHVALRLGLAELIRAQTGQAPEFLLVDEPTDLDSAGIRMLADLLPRTGRQVILVTHEAELVDAMPQRFAVSRESSTSASAVIEV